MKDSKTPGRFNFAERQAQKARAREKDLERLRRREISAIDLQKESMHFRNLRKDRIGFMRDKDGKMQWLAPRSPNDNKGHEE
jgi:hypothetical protein